MTAVALLRRHRIGSLPVMQNKELVGIITRSDILDFVLSGNSGGKRARRAKKTRPERRRPARKRRR